MEEKLKDAQYASDNFDTLRENVYSYASYAKHLCSMVEHEDATLYEKVEKAQDGIDELVKYIDGVIKEATDGSR